MLILYNRLVIFLGGLYGIEVFLCDSIWNVNVDLGLFTEEVELNNMPTIFIFNDEHPMHQSK